MASSKQRVRWKQDEKWSYVPDPLRERDFASANIKATVLGRPGVTHEAIVLISPSELDRLLAILQACDDCYRDFVGYDDGYDTGHQAGHDEGFDSGYDTGYRDALAAVETLTSDHLGGEAA